MLAVFPDLPNMKVIDLGGTIQFWERLPFHPKHLTTLNGYWEPTNQSDYDWHVDVGGDACDPPPDVRAQTFDLVFSNSTIEHVGDQDRRRQFAEVVHTLAERHWIQTPNRAFPVEPHVLFPFQQFLPRQGRALVERYWPLVHTRRPTMEQALEAADGTELLWRGEMKQLFPTSEIESEVVTPVLPAKSVIAVRS
jgi:hypothetical protein